MDCPDENDPIIAEVRRIREEIAAKCGYDTHRIFEYCRQRAQEIQERWAQEDRARAEEESASAQDRPGLGERRGQ